MASYFGIVPRQYTPKNKWIFEDFPSWRAALERFASVFVKYFSQCNSYGIMPCRIYPDKPPQRARNWQGHPYRFFIETNFRYELSFSWQTGNTATLAGYGVTMMYAAEILGQPGLRRQAQRQWDWILGVNPFDASMVLGVGRNNPPTYTSKEVVPPIPDIVGAVFEGPIGDDEDNPLVFPGYFATCEYWLPHQSWALWLVAELSANHSVGP